MLNFMIWLCLQPIWLIGKLISIVRRQVMGGRVIVKRGDVIYVPLWVPVTVGMLLALSAVWDDVLGVARALKAEVTRVVYTVTHPPTGEIALLFTEPVQHWAGKIEEWADLYQVEPNLLATVMQIESCGHPTVVSSAGARGLFQVMPFHFASDENMVDPDTNAKRGGNFLNYCLGAANGDVGLALACYNGGPSVINRPLNTWASETQRYYRWGVGIYGDAVMNRPQSDTLDAWMQAGGSRLCQLAGQEIGIYSSSVVLRSSP